MLCPTVVLTTNFAAYSMAALVGRLSIKWNEYKDFNVNSDLTYQFSKLFVPLDHVETTRSELDLQLLRVPAERQPAKGSVHFNFGGPGTVARNTLVS